MKNSKQVEHVFVSEEVLEVRYKPRGSFLSSIGDIADYVVDQGLFRHWKIENSNKINFHNETEKQEKFLAFMSYRNAGCVAFDPDTRNFFKDKATQYWKTISQNKFFPIPDPLRIGVRTKCFIKMDISFEEIEDRMFKYFFNPSVLSDIKLKRKDLQVVLDFEGDSMSMRVTFGPLPKNQAFQLFQFKSDHFESTGIFFDFDCYTNNPSPTNQKVVEAFIKRATETNWEQIDRVLEKIGG
jgi:hypothetical protein